MLAGDVVARAHVFVGILARAMSVAAVAVLVSMGVVLSPAHGETTNLRLDAGPASPLVAVGSPVSMTLDAHNDSEQSATSNTVSLAVSRASLVGNDDIDAWLSSQISAGSAVVTASLAAIGPKSHAVSSALIPAEHFPAAGVWGIAATWNSQAGTVSTRTIVSVGSPGAPKDVAQIYALTPGPVADGLLTAEQLQEMTAPGGALADALDGLVARTVTVGIDPRIIVSIRALGDSAPQEAARWLDKLSTLSSTFPLQYADADPAVQAQLGLSTLLGPGAFSDLGLSEADLGSLESFPYSRTNLVWPADNSVRQSDLGVFAASGLPETILMSGNLQSSGPVAQLDGSRVLMIDESISAAFAHALSATSFAQANSATAETVARINASTTSALLLSNMRAVPAGSNRLTSVLDALVSSGSARLVSVSDLESRGSVTAALIEQSENAQRLAAAQEVLDREAEVSRFSAIATTPSQLTDAQRRSALAMLGVPWMRPGSDWGAALATYNADAATTLSAVRVTSSSVVNVVASSASIPLSIENDLPVAISAQIRVAPSNGRLIIGQVDPIEIGPNSRATVLVPVESRIGNGSVQLTTSIFALDGTPIGESVVIPANVQADWEGWGAIVIALVFTALFVAGIIRQVRRRRSTRAPSASETSRVKAPDDV